MNKIGIYKIISPTGRIYIGQSVDIEKRKNQYIKLNKNNIGPKIYNSLKKYGWEYHKFEIIEECFTEQLNEREIYWKQYYLDLLNNNWKQVLFCELYDNGGGPKSEETKRKIGKGNSGKIFTKEHKNKIGQSKLNNKYTLGFKFSNESKQKISLSKTNHICYKTPERGKKISESLKGKKRPEYLKNLISKLKSKPILQYDLEGNFIKEWNSGTEAAKVLNISQTGINNCCNNIKSSFKKNVWKFKNN